MWPFPKKQPAVDPGPPPGLDTLHDEAIPEGGYPIIPSGFWGGPSGWSPTVETIPEIDDVYIHYDAPAADSVGNPNTFWQQRNKSLIDRAAENEDEVNSGKGWYVAQHENQIVQNPYIIALPRPNRVTAYESPSNYRFLAYPDGLFRSKRNLNGMHFSMAQMHRSYPILGMEPAHRFRNTYRIEPPSRDSMNTDLPMGAGTTTVPGALYNSPDLPIAPSMGRTYRLQ